MLFIVFEPVPIKYALIIIGVMMFSVVIGAMLLAKFLCWWYDV